MEGGLGEPRDAACASFASPVGAAAPDLEPLWITKEHRQVVVVDDHPSRVLRAGTEALIFTDEVEASSG